MRSALYGSATRATIEDAKHLGAGVIILACEGEDA